MEEEKYNLVTQELLLAGYCAEHHPDYVVIPAGRCGASPLDNTDGGFVYSRKYLEKAVFVTGCGLSVRYRECIGRLDYMDRMFCAENDNVIVKCPKYKKVCADNDPLLSSESNYLCFCVCHMASDYTYEKSIQHLTEEADQLKEERFEKFKARHKNRICLHHMQYDYKKQEWSMNYNPLVCVSTCDPGDYCSLRGKQLSAQKGNVFYDVKVSTLRKDGTLFDGESVTSIIKGKKFLKKQASLDICKAVIKMNTKDIIQKEWENGYSRLALTDPDLKLEILNVRSAARVHRNKEQDLLEQKEGIQICYESDMQKAVRREKQKQKEKRLQRIQRKVQTKGLDALTDAEKRFVGKRMTKEQIEQLEWQKSQTLKVMKEDQQLSLLEYEKERNESYGKTKALEAETVRSNG